LQSLQSVRRQIGEFLTEKRIHIFFDFFSVKTLVKFFKSIDILRDVLFDPTEFYGILRNDMFLPPQLVSHFLQESISFEKVR